LDRLLEHAGVGLGASFFRLTPRQLRELISRVLTADSFRVRVRQMQQTLANAEGASRAANIVGHALLSGRPVEYQPSN